MTTSAEDRTVLPWPGTPLPVSPGWHAVLLGDGAPRITRLYRDRTGRVRRAAPAAGDDQEAVLRHSTTVRSVAREWLPRSRNDGIDIQRVDRFLASRGLRAPPALLLTRAEVAQFRDHMQERCGWGNESLDRLASPDHPEFGGSYIAELGMVVMVRNEAMERLNGTAYTEARLVHEKAHGNNVDNNVACEKEGRNGSYIHRRSGFTCMRNARSAVGQAQGSFLEEGFAELLAGEYVSSELGLPYGPWRDGNRQPLGHGLGGVPSRHFWREGANGEQLYIAWAALAATGLQQLIRRRPELWPALVSARTSVQGLRDVARIVESAGAGPGLYGRLRRLNYSPADFTTGLAAIQSLPPRSAAPRAAATPGRAREQPTVREPQAGPGLPAGLSPRTVSALPGPPHLRTAAHSPVRTPVRAQPGAGRPRTRPARGERASGTAPVRDGG